MSKYGTGASRVVAHLDEESKRQISVLSEIFRMSTSNVLSSAIARWFHNEPLVEKYEQQRKENGDDHSGL